MRPKQGHTPMYPLPTYSRELHTYSHYSLVHSLAHLIRRENWPINWRWLFGMGINHAEIERLARSSASCLENGNRLRNLHPEESDRDAPWGNVKCANLASEMKIPSFATAVSFDSTCNAVMVSHRRQFVAIPETKYFNISSMFLK